MQAKITDNIYRIIKRQGISQVELASRIGITPQRMNDYLKGRRPLRAALLIPICEALDCEPNELFGWPARYHQEVVTDKDGKVLAVITDDSVVEHEGYHVGLT